MFTFIIAGIMTATAMFVLLCKLGIRKFTRHHVITDLAVSICFTGLLAGTITGMMAAIIAGLFFSFLLWITKKVIDIYDDYAIVYQG